MRIQVGTALVGCLLLALTGSASAFGDDHDMHGAMKHDEDKGHSHASAEMHGGNVTMTKEFHFEVAFDRDAVYVFGYDAKQNPLNLEGTSGTVSINFQDKKRKSVDAQLHFMKASNDHTMGAGIPQPMDHGFLMATIDLSKVPEGQAKATFNIDGLQGKSEKKVQFRETFQMATLTEYACPMNDTPPASAPGKCSKCGMVLERQRYIFACEKHPSVTSRTSDEKCWVDGAAMHRRDPDAKEQAADAHDHGGHGH